MCRRLFLLTSFLLVLALVSTDVALADVIEIPIATENDDAEDHQWEAGAEALGSSDLEMPYEDSGTPPAEPQIIGLRFVNIPIQKGETIVNAYVQFTGDNEKLTGGPVNLIINGLLQLNPEEFGDDEGFYTTREPKTASEVKWTGVPDWSVHEATDASRTPDIASVIQEIVNQDGWTSGNALMLFIRDDETNPSGSIRSAISNGGAPGTEPLLHIEFSAAAALPEGWQSRDIGTTGGSAAESGGTWAISADGADVWGTWDQFHYAFMPLSGDGTIVARVVDTGTGSDSWAKGGVMIRETLDQGSKHAIMAITGGDGGGKAFQHRPVAYERSMSAHGGDQVAPPMWIKLTRVGNTFTGYYSVDGVNWVEQENWSLDGGDVAANPATIEMATDVYIGLFVTSHASGEVRTYTFDNVSVVKPTGYNIIWVTATRDYDLDGVQDDQAFIDWLVAEGRTVDVRIDYWNELDLNKVDELNAADLVIVSRSSNSSDLDDGDEPTLWNSVTTPLILMNGYIVRSSRWRWMDTTAIVNRDHIMLALDTTHPVFEGVTFEMGNVVTFLDNTVGSGQASFVDSIDVGNGTLIAQTLADFTWIAEWPAGAEFYAGSGQIAGGPRMLFAAGTQEIDGPPPTPWGAWNLTSDGEIMFRNAINSMLRVQVADVTAPGDIVKGVPDDGDWPRTYRPETPDMAIDDNIETKYLHFKGDFNPDPGTGGAGFRVTPSAGPTIVTGLTLTTANDVPGRDPIAFELSGSNESIDGPYELIASGDVVDFAQADEWPRFTMNATPISFDNDVAYAHYQLIFTAIRGPVGGSVNSMQIAEVELLGELYVDADIAAIEELMDLYALAMTTGDLDLWMSLYTDDAVKMLPDAPATFGKEELRASMKPLFDNFTFEEMVIYDLVIQVAGDWAVSWCTYTFLMTPKAGGEPLHIDAKDLCILERQADGSWKIYWDCWNSNVSPPQ